MQLNEDVRREMHSGDYVQVLEDVPLTRMVRLLPLMEFKPGDRLVDFACGTGALSQFVHDKIRSYDGVDFSPDFVAAATKRAAGLGITNASFHCEDIVAFCDKHAGAFDIVTAFDFSEHIYDDDFLKIFTGAYNVLEPGGSLYLYTPNLDFFYERMKDVGLAKQFTQHIAVRNDRQHLELLKRCGFAEDKISCRYPSHFNIFRTLHPLSRLPVVGRWFKAKLFFRCVK